MGLGRRGGGLSGGPVGRGSKSGRREDWVDEGRGGNCRGSGSETWLSVSSRCVQAAAEFDFKDAGARMKT